jgi:chromosomal replication initiator protein
MAILLAGQFSMVTRNAVDIWSQVRDRVRDELDNPNYDYLLEGTRPIEAAEDSLTVGVPSQFARDWLDARLLPELEQFLHAVTGRTLRLTLAVAGGSAENKPSNGSAKEGRSQQAKEREIPGQQRLSFHSQASEVGKGSRTTTLAGGLLHPRYTFDSFVVGASNRFAHAGARAVAEEPGAGYNPLFLYGGVGLGKTHLMHAIAHYAAERHPKLHVVYVTSERFTNELINSIMTKSTAQFRSLYRQADILLIDDIQFVAGKEQTQEEIFHTFNALYEAGRQLVISSDRPPREIPTLEDRLRSRFEWGLTADIQAPDLETRIAILRQKALTEEYSPPSEVLTYIAKHIRSNIRELEGALIRVMAFSALHDNSLTVDLAQEALKDVVTATPPQMITIPLIQETVADHFNLKITDMRSKKRSRHVAFPRQIAMYLSRELTDSSLPRIGEEFGGRDHTTVMHACDKIKSESATDANLAATLQELRVRLEAE